MSVRVLLADDQQLVRAGFRLILDTEPDIEVAGEAGDGADAVRLTALLRPDVVLMDIRMPGTDGIEATRRLTAAGSQARVVILTTFDTDDHVFDALAAGASGFLLKSSPPEQLVEAIRVVAAGEALLAPQITRRVVAAALERGRRREPPRGLADLTDREREVLQDLAGGMTNAEIGRHLYVSEATVKTHVSRLLTKLGLRDRVHAVIYAYENGLVG